MPVETVLRIWLKNSEMPPQRIWRQNGIDVVNEVRGGPDYIDLRVRGDGRAAELFVNSREDLFFACNVNPPDPKA